MPNLPTLHIFIKVHQYSSKCMYRLNKLHTSIQKSNERRMYRVMKARKPHLKLLRRSKHRRKLHSCRKSLVGNRPIFHFQKFNTNLEGTSDLLFSPSWLFKGSQRTPQHKKCRPSLPTTPIRKNASISVKNLSHSSNTWPR